MKRSMSVGGSDLCYRQDGYATCDGVCTWGPKDHFLLQGSAAPLFRRQSIPFSCAACNLDFISCSGASIIDNLFAKLAHYWFLDGTYSSAFEQRS